MSSPLPPTEKRAWIAHVTGSEGGAVDWREIRLHRGLNECRCPGLHQWTKETEFVVVPEAALREAEGEIKRLMYCCERKDEDVQNARQDRASDNLKGARLLAAAQQTIAELEARLKP